MTPIGAIGYTLSWVPVGGDAAGGLARPIDRHLASVSSRLYLSRTAMRLKEGWSGDFEPNARAPRSGVRRYPRRWERRHLILDAPVPHVFWAPEIQKSKRRQLVALHPALAHALKLHLETRDLKPSDPVFPRAPNRDAFKLDALNAGVSMTDAYGARYSPHSARKWFETTMIAAGVSPRMVDYLMRHSGGVQGRYYQPNLDEQAAALAKLPTLGVSPGALVQAPVPAGLRRKLGKNVTETLAEGQETTDDVGAKPMQLTSLNSIQPPTDARIGFATSAAAQAAPSVRGSIEFRTLGPVGRGVEESGAAVSGSKVGGFTPEVVTPKRNALADLFDATARLLRQEGDREPDNKS